MIEVRCRLVLQAASALVSGQRALKVQIEESHTRPDILLATSRSQISRNIDECAYVMLEGAFGACEEWWPCGLLCASSLHTRFCEQPLSMYRKMY